MTKRNRKKFGRTIVWQHLKDEMRSPYSGESSPYWEWAEKHSETSKESHEIEEHPRANPDQLEDTNTYQAKRIVLQEMIKSVYNNLSLKETQVFNLLSKGLTENDIAKKLKVSRSRIKECRIRIKNKFKTYGDKDA